MDRQTVIAVLLCFLIFVGWQKFYIEPRLPKQPQQTAQQTLPQQTTPSDVSHSTPSPGRTSPMRPVQAVSLDSGTGRVQISDAGSVFSDWALRDYHQGLSAEARPVNLDSVMHVPGAVDSAFDIQALSYLSQAQGALQKTDAGATWSYEDQNVRARRTIQASPGSSAVDLTYDFQFKSSPPHYVFISLSGEKPAGKDNEARDHQLLYYTSGSIQRQQISDSVPLRDVLTPVKYIGVQGRYFVFALLNSSSLEAKALIQPWGLGRGRISLVFPVSGNSISIPLKAYFGPKALPLLRSVDPALDQTVDFGWFTPIAYPLLAILRWFYQFVGNYGAAIILLTILLKLATYPLTYKSMKSMKEMARLQPQLAALKERYKDNKEEQNKKTLELMREHGYNPAAGCLPMFVQMPVFFALYRVLYSAIELYHAPFALWIKDLSAPDPFYATPILMSLTMFAQQRLSPSPSADPAQQKMMMMMPLVFGFFMLNLPSGLTLYMLVNAAVSIIQQLIMNKKLSIGHAPAPAT